MELRHIERGTKLTIYEELQQRAVSDEYEATLRYHENDRLIVVQCAWLYENYDRMSLGAQLNVSYASNAIMHTFIGRTREKLRGNGLVMIEQVSDIETKMQRQFDRDEIRVHVDVFGLPEAKALAAELEIPEGKPDLADTSFDISSGGLCVITNTLLSSKYDPYYLVVFSLSEKDRFLIPSKIVRKSNYPRTKIGRYDYGFQFIFDKLPEEKARLTRAILNRKLSQR